MFSKKMKSLYIIVIILFAFVGCSDDLSNDNIMIK